MYRASKYMIYNCSRKTGRGKAEKSWETVAYQAKIHSVICWKVRAIGGKVGVSDKKNEDAIQEVIGMTRKIRVLCWYRMVRYLGRLPT